jgi:hypothetical protein
LIQILDELEKQSPLCIPCDFQDSLDRDRFTYENNVRMLEFFNKLEWRDRDIFTLGLFGSKLGSHSHTREVPVHMKKHALQTVGVI